MHCPKCGAENPDNVKLCQSCNWDLASVLQVTRRLEIRIRKYGISSLILSFSSIGMFFFFASINIPHEIRFIVLLSPLISIIALGLGIKALVNVKKNTHIFIDKHYAIGSTFVAVVCLFATISFYFYFPLKSYPGLHHKNRFHGIDVSLEFFKTDEDYYPPSAAIDGDNQSYCGAMKLCEALLGQDLIGFHPDSLFKRNGTDANHKILYSPATLRARKSLYLSIERANVYRLKDIYKNVGTFDGNNVVLCDWFEKKRYSGKQTGMPILYYKARINFNEQDCRKGPKGKEIDDDIYYFPDNEQLIRLGSATVPDLIHPLVKGTNAENWMNFEKMILNYNIQTNRMPYRADSYILISAGLDGLYGTQDDICNF